MGKAIIKTFVQFSLLVINLDGIIALLWKYDIFYHNGSFIFDDFYVGTIRNNKSLIEKATILDTTKFLKILEQRERGYSLTEREIRKLKLWPKGVIPYYIDPVSYDKDYRDNLRQTLTEISYLSGIDFRELRYIPKDQSLRYLNIVNRIGSACTHSRFTSQQFTLQGPQKVVLGFNSVSNGDLYPLVLAVAGIPPQNNAPFRDHFIKILKENIITDKIPLFKYLHDDEWLFHDLPYDFSSASHFHYHEYTRNGQSTIKPKHSVPGPTTQGFSFYDIIKMRRAYNFITNKEYSEYSVPGKPSYMYPRPLTSSQFQGFIFGNPDDRKGIKLNSVEAHNFKTKTKSKQLESGSIRKKKSKHPRKKHHELNENPDVSNEEYRDNKMDQLNDSELRIGFEHKEKKTNKDARGKRPKFNKFQDKSHLNQDKSQEDYNGFEKGREINDNERHKKKDRISRPKPGKYLGIDGEDPAQQVEEYIPEKLRHEMEEKRQAELSEDIDVYLSESSQEEDNLYPSEFIKPKKNAKAKKSSTNNIKV